MADAKWTRGVEWVEVGIGPGLDAGIIDTFVAYLRTPDGLIGLGRNVIDAGGYQVIGCAEDGLPVYERVEDGEHG